MKINEIFEAYNNQGAGFYEFGVADAGNAAKIKKALNDANIKFKTGKGGGNKFFFFDNAKQHRAALSIAKKVIDYSKEDSYEWKKPRGLKEESSKDANINLILKAIAKSTGITFAQARAIFVGGDAPGMRGAIDKLEADGFDSAGAWFENKDWYHKHGISKKDYNLLVKYSSDDKVNEAHFEDDQVELETHPVDHDQDDLLAFCKKRGIKVEKRGAHNLVRFSGKKEDLRDMINQFWGEPADYLSQIKEEKEAYTQGNEFDADMDAINEHLKKAAEILKSKRMKKHILDTKQNLGIETRGRAATAVKAIETAKEAVSAFYDKMMP